MLAILHYGLKTFFQSHARAHGDARAVAQLNWFFVVGMCLDKGRAWAQNQGQGETLALIPNMMDNQGVNPLPISRTDLGRGRNKRRRVIVNY